MKRRKKLWIACAALAVVVALCALALLYRPAPYRFLEGSRHVRTEVLSALGYGPVVVVRTYRVRGTVGSVAEKAQAELKPQDGWRIGRLPDGEVLFGGRDKGVRITTGELHVGPKREKMPDEPGTVFVTIDNEPTLIDRFLYWLEHR